MRGLKSDGNARRPRGRKRTGGRAGDKREDEAGSLVQKDKNCAKPGGTRTRLTGNSPLPTVVRQTWKDEKIHRRRRNGGQKRE
ncbi:hypothetical protein Naga_101768g1 [Nannochloropsis gaditana]|uniref:Uncharacterized protein n=1 Tax=Nannochloropsis gaditana TaxID=72520 RepID=W7U682_9STRA|nr:hypothetical protein Naga_101768g1 [Nannochloropsis gaditana]